MTCEKNILSAGGAEKTGLPSTKSAPQPSPKFVESKPASPRIGRKEAVNLIYKGNSLKAAIVRDDKSGHQVFYQMVEMGADEICELYEH